MKALLPLLFSFAISLQVSGQANIPFPTDNSVKWFYLRDSHSPISPNCCYTYFTQTLIGDTIIGNEVYSKLYDIESASSSYAFLPSIGDTNWMYAPSLFNYYQDTVLEAYIREDTNRRVTYYRPGFGPSLPYNAFDFSLQPGDTLTVGENPILFQVDSIDSVFTVNEYRKVQHQVGDPYNLWVEGIGSSYYFPSQMTPFEGSCYLVGFMRNDTCIYGNCPQMDYALTSVNGMEQKFSVNLFPNPVKDKLEIFSSGEDLESIEIFSAAGKMLGKFNLNNQRASSIDVSEFARGFYFYSILAKDGTRSNGKIVLE